MIGGIITDLVAGMIGETLFGGWIKRHPRLTAAICLPLLILIFVLAARQWLGG